MLPDPSAVHAPSPIECLQPRYSNAVLRITPFVVPNCFAINSLVSMRALGFVLGVALWLPVHAQTRVDPKAISIYPFTGQRGTTFLATVRGNGLQGASSA